MVYRPSFLTKESGDHKGVRLVSTMSLKAGPVSGGLVFWVRVEIFMVPTQEQLTGSSDARCSLSVQLL